MATVDQMNVGETLNVAGRLWVYLTTRGTHNVFVSQVMPPEQAHFSTGQKDYYLRWIHRDAETAGVATSVRMGQVSREHLHSAYLQWRGANPSADLDSIPSDQLAPGAGAQDHQALLNNVDPAQNLIGGGAAGPAQAAQDAAQQQFQQLAQQAGGNDQAVMALLQGQQSLMMSLIDSQNAMRQQMLTTDENRRDELADMRDMMRNIEEARRRDQQKHEDERREDAKKLEERMADMERKRVEDGAQRAEKDRKKEERTAWRSQKVREYSGNETDYSAWRDHAFPHAIQGLSLGIPESELITAIVDNWIALAVKKKLGKLNELYADDSKGEDEKAGKKFTWDVLDLHNRPAFFKYQTHIALDEFPAKDGEKVKAYVLRYERAAQNARDAGNNVDSESVAMTALHRAKLGPETTSHILENLSGKMNFDELKKRFITSYADRKIGDGDPNQVYFQKKGAGKEKLGKPEKRMNKNDKKGKGKKQDKATTGKGNADKICFNCREKGHISTDCPKLKEANREAEKKKARTGDVAGTLLADYEDDNDATAGTAWVSISLRHRTSLHDFPGGFG